MPLAQALAEFKVNVLQCESLIANAHKTDHVGVPILPALDQQQITVAAFLNTFIAWETFLELSITELMIGAKAIGGKPIVKFVNAKNYGAATDMLMGTNRYFDYGNHDFVRKIVNIYFELGYPFEPHLSSINSELCDIRTIRNSCAHITSSTQRNLESLALRLLSNPHNGITVYKLLASVDPTSLTNDTVFLTYKKKLVVAAELIARG
jgi:hypothetical protein